MKSLIAFLLVFLLLGATTEACQHVPAQALLQGVTCPTCGAMAQAVVQPQVAVQYVQQPVQTIQRVIVQQPVVQNVVTQPLYTSSAVVSNVVTTPIVTTPFARRGLSVLINGPLGGSFNASLGLGFGANAGLIGSNVIVAPSFGFGAHFGGGHR